MVKKSMDDDQMMEEFDDEGSLEFDQEDELVTGEDELLLEGRRRGGGSHSFRSVQGVSRPKTEDDWRQLLLEAGREGVPTYQMGDTYREGDLLVHPVFGLGVVSKVISPRKMEIVFESSKKLLAMSITPPA